MIITAGEVVLERFPLSLLCLLKTVPRDNLLQHVTTGSFYYLLFLMLMSRWLHAVRLSVSLPSLSSADDFLLIIIVCIS